MEKPQNSKKSAKSDEPFHLSPKDKTLYQERSQSLVEELDKYLPLFLKITGSYDDAIVLKHDVSVKLLSVLIQNLKFWQKVKNKSGYIKTTAKNAHNDWFRSEYRENDKSKDEDKSKNNNLSKKSDKPQKKRVVFCSLDDEKNKSIENGLSDEGKAAENMDNDLDKEELRNRLNNFTKSFLTKDEQKLIELKYIDLLVPKQISEIRNENFRNIQAECNAVDAKFRYHVKNEVKKNK